MIVVPVADLNPVGHLELEVVLDDVYPEVQALSPDAVAGKVGNLNDLDLEDEVELNTDTVEIILNKTNN